VHVSAATESTFVKPRARWFGHRYCRPRPGPCRCRAGPGYLSRRQTGPRRWSSPSAPGIRRIDLRPRHRVAVRYDVRGIGGAVRVRIAAEVDRGAIGNSGRGVRIHCALRDDGGIGLAAARTSLRTQVTLEQLQPGPPSEVICIPVTVWSVTCTALVVGRCRRCSRGSRRRHSSDRAGRCRYG